MDVPQKTSDQAERFKELFENACLIRMRADVPVGTSLSGGLDSSSVVATLAGLGLNEKNIAFIHSFEGTAIDETEYAKIVIQTTGNHAVYVQDYRKNLDIDHLNQMLFSFESIYAGMPDSAYRIYQKQRESGVYVSLDGHGADEMLGGYPHYIDAALKDVNILFHPGRFFELLSIKNQMIQNPQSRSHFRGGLHFLSGIRLFQFLKIARNRILRKNLLRSEFLKKSIEPYAAQLPTMPNNWSRLQKRLYVDFHATVLPRILKNFDLMSMANGVEVRMPFMDFRIVNFVFSLPDNAKIGEGYTKNILRQAMKDRIDDRVRLRRTKIGFNSPVVDLLRSDLKPWVYDCLDGSSAYSDLIDKKKLKNMYEQKILPGHGDWQESLEFWKYISAFKLIKFLKESNGLQHIN
ncbi:MAG: asparagine synthase C-terminal domain-containing protein [Desulfosalsimonadaceae bacterium]